MLEPNGGTVNGTTTSSSISAPSNLTTGNATTTYQNYPANKPFINTEWTRQRPGMVSKAFPESNRDLIISSLKKLQQKLNQLELNTNETNNNEKEDTTPKVYSAYPIIGTNQSHTIPQKQPHPLTVVTNYIDDFNDGYLNSNLNGNLPNNQYTNGINNNHIIDEKSLNTEKRVLELERQLEKMRKLLNDDSEKNLAGHHKDVADNNGNFLNEDDFTRKKSRLNAESDTTLRDIDLDQEFSSHEFDNENNLYQNPKLNKKRSRNSKKLSSKHQPILLSQIRANPLPATNLNTSIQLEQSSSSISPSIPPEPTQTNETYFVKSFHNNNRSRSVEENLLLRSNSKGQCHYRLKLGDIPFVVGKSTTPSHHLGSNIQNVISLLKMHHPKICGQMHGFNGSHASPASTSSSLRKNLPKRTPSMPSTNRKRDYNQNINNQNLQQPQQQQQKPFRISRSKSVPYWPSNLTKPLTYAKKTIDHQNQRQQPQYYNINQQSQQNVNKQQAHQHNNEIESKLTNSIDNLEWNELLRVLQEEYTKLVLQHYDITKKIMSCYDADQRSEFENHAEYLHKKMRVKAKQINKLKSANIQNQQLRHHHNHQSKQCGPPTQKENEFVMIQSRKPSYPKTTSSMSNSTTSSNHLHLVHEHLNKSSTNPSNANNYQHQYQSNFPNHSKTLKLFKDIKNLQCIIQNND